MDEREEMNMDARDKEHEIEQWLDAALRQYGNAEPRIGLENRVLANVQSERNRIASQRRWWWAAGMVTVAAIVAALWVGETGSGKHPATTVGNTTPTHRQAAEAPRGPMPRAPVTHPVKEVVRRHPGKQPIRDLALTAPKLDQFPSPTPLNEQEKMLARYVQEFPQKAALVARAQTDLRKLDEREMAAPRPRDAGSKSSDQQE